MYAMTTRKRNQGKRTGFTTGACAAAAASAATIGLIKRIPQTDVEIFLPNQNRVTFTVVESSVDILVARAVIVKDAGDDPDITNGAKITAEVRRIPKAKGEIRIIGGKGVGQVTRPGLVVQPGNPAINPIPLQNIEANVRLAAENMLAHDGLKITIIVPRGEKMAQRTLNPRLGIVGGISILGTSGIVYPYSTAAYKACIIQTIQAAVAQKAQCICLTTGRRTEKYAMAQLPSMEEHCFIQMGDFVGAALSCVGELPVTSVVIAAMAGKLSKIAKGVNNTHARKSSVDMTYVADIARSIGAPETVCKRIAGGITVQYGADLMRAEGLDLHEAFYQSLCNAAHQAVCKHLAKGVALTVMAFSSEGHCLCTVSEVVDGS